MRTLYSRFLFSGQLEKLGTTNFYKYLTKRHLNAIFYNQAVFVCNNIKARITLQYKVIQEANFLDYEKHICHKITKLSETYINHLPSYIFPRTFKDLFKLSKYVQHRT